MKDVMKMKIFRVVMLLIIINIVASIPLVIVLHAKINVFFLLPVIVPPVPIPATNPSN